MRILGNILLLPTNKSHIPNRIHPFTSRIHNNNNLRTPIQHSHWNVSFAMHNSDYNVHACQDTKFNFLVMNSFREFYAAA